MSEIAIGTAAFIAITVFAACGSDGASSAGTGKQRHDQRSGHAGYGNRRA
jgi:hypothetical protein